MSEKRVDLVVAVILFCYFISVALSFSRVYVFHAYPIYYTEDEIPSLSEMINDVPSLLNQ